jgi:hypothetical protein
MKPFEKASLFWDCDPKTLDRDEHAQFIIERILARGDVEDFRWARRTYSEKKLRETFLRSRTLDRKSFNFWCQYFNFPKELCAKKQLTKKRNVFWGR